MAINQEDVERIAQATADEVVARMQKQRDALELRDVIIGWAIGEGAIALHGREDRKAPCHGCRIDPTKPLEAGNVMATTEDAIGTLSAQEVRDWCSEIVEVKDGRCIRVGRIRAAANRCRELYPNDTSKFFECYAPSWSAITKG